MIVGVEQVFSRWRKVDSDGADVMSAGRLFETRGPAYDLYLSHFLDINFWLFAHVNRSLADDTNRVLSRLG